MFITKIFLQIYEIFDKYLKKRIFKDFPVDCWLKIQKYLNKKETCVLVLLNQQIKNTIYSKSRLWEKYTLYNKNSIKILYNSERHNHTKENIKNLKNLEIQKKIKEEEIYEIIQKFNDLETLQFIETDMTNMRWILMKEIKKMERLKIIKLDSVVVSKDTLDLFFHQLKIQELELQGIDIEEFSLIKLKYLKILKIRDCKIRNKTEFILGLVGMRQLQVLEFNLMYGIEEEDVRFILDYKKPILKRFSITGIYFIDIGKSFDEKFIVDVKNNYQGVKIDFIKKIVFDEVKLTLKVNHLKSKRIIKKLSFNYL
jgi:hypothetical protein